MQRRLENIEAIWPVQIDFFIIEATLLHLDTLSTIFSHTKTFISNAFFWHPLILLNLSAILGTWTKMTDWPLELRGNKPCFTFVPIFFRTQPQFFLLYYVARGDVKPMKIRREWYQQKNTKTKQINIRPVKAQMLLGYANIRSLFVSNVAQYLSPADKRRNKAVEVYIGLSPHWIVRHNSSGFSVSRFFWTSNTFERILNIRRLPNQSHKMTKNSILRSNEHPLGPNHL